MTNSPKEDPMQALARLAEESRPYSELFSNAYLKINSITTYYESAMRVLSQAEDISDLRSVVDLLTAAASKTKVMTAAVQEKIDHLESS